MITVMMTWDDDVGEDEEHDDDDCDSNDCNNEDNYADKGEKFHDDCNYAWS